MKKQSQFYVRIMTPHKTLYQGNIFALSLYNDIGPFDIIEKHTNFISLIKNKITIHELPRTKKEISIQKGIVKVNKQGVDIFIGFMEENEYER